MRRNPLVALLALGLGCSSHHTPSTIVRPLPETGLVSADLSGRWRITEVDASEHVARMSGNEVPEIDPLCGLVSLVPGAVLDVARGELQSVGGCVLRMATVDREVVTLYLNQVSDRFVIYAAHQDATRSRMADGASYVLEVALGTVDRDHLMGLVYYRGASFYMPEGIILRHLARVVLAREP